MIIFSPILLGLVIAVNLLGAATAGAESHRATHLGNPATRFALPLHTPEDLRSRFADAKLQPDFAEVLRQWGWTGKVEDLFAAAATAEIFEASIAEGETMPFMSSREQGQPICLRNVTWAGKEAAPAYAFEFNSNGRRYRCITPKACSNFFVVDLGAEPKPVLALSCSASAEVLAGRPVNVCLKVINSGNRPEPKVTVSLPLPEGSAATSLTDHGKVMNGQAVWEIASLAPNKGKEVCATLAVPQTGVVALKPLARGEVAVPVECTCESKVVGVSGILLEVVDIADPIEIGKEVTYEIRVTNQGSATGTNIRLKCLLPECQQFVSGKGETAVSAEGGVIALAPLPALAPKAVATWQVVVKAAQAADARFKAELTSDQFEKPIIEFESTAQY